GLDALRLFQIAADPSGVLFAGTERGLYRSRDGGAQWSRVLADPVFQVAPDPSTPGTIYVSRSATVPLAKSTDGGDTWQPLPSGPGLNPPPVLAIDPHTPGRIYAGGDHVYRSDDGGATWTLGPRLAGSAITSLAVDAGDSSVVYAVVASTPG